MSDEVSNVYNRADISLYIDDVKTDIIASSYTFTLYDSIYELFPKAKLCINDDFGNLNEYLALTNGTKIEIKYGLTSDNIKSAKYRVVKNAIPEQRAQGLMGGTTELSLIHDYFHYQTKTSDAFDLNISDIITKLVSKYNFSKIDIDQTLNSGVWYQPFITDADFMVNHLLPYAYSTSSSDSPFYCFIDINNGFHFKNYKSMINTRPIQQFYLDINGDYDTVDNDKIQTIRYAQTSSSDITPYIHRILTYWDENGEFVKQDAYLTDYPKNIVNPIPIKANESYTTDIECMFCDDINVKETKNNRKGFEINKLKKAINTDKTILSINFNNNIVCGDLIKLNIPSTTSNHADDLSLRNSGNYLVESTYQIWNGKNLYTMLVCSKQDIKVTNEYRNVKLILNRN